MFHVNTGKTTVEFLKDAAPSIGITTNALMKMRAYVQENSQEISWLGVVDTTDTGYIISDVMLFEQKVTGTTTEICESDLSTFGSNLVMEGKVDLYNKIRMWGHSHVEMQVFASGTDEATFQMFYVDPVTGKMLTDFFIRLICNKKDEITIDFMDCVSGIRYLNVKWYEVKSEEQLQLEELIAVFQKQQKDKYAAITAAAKEEIKSNIKYSYSYGSTTYGRTYSGYSYQDDDYAAGYPRGGDRFVTAEKKTTPTSPIDLTKEREEKEKAKGIVTKVDEAADYDEKKNSSISPLPDVPIKYNGKIEMAPASTVLDDPEEIAAIMEEVFSPLDLGSRLCMVEEFEEYDVEDWNRLYDILFDWYYDNYLDVYSEQEELIVKS